MTSQNYSEIKNLVFSGGGFNGIAFIGALEKCTKTKELNMEKIKSYAGTSIGSLISLFLCINYSLEEIKNIIFDLDFHKLRSVSFFNLIKSNGLDTGENILEWIRFLLKNKGFDANINFKNLYGITNKKLITVCSNISTEESVYCDYEQTPDLEVAIGVRMSISIPFLFSPVKWKNHLYIDGVFSNPFPLELFKENKDETLGLQLNSNNYKPSAGTPTTFFNFVLLFSKFIMKNIHQYKVEHNLKLFPHIINLNIDHNNLVNYSLKLEHKQSIYQEAYDSII